MKLCIRAHDLGVKGTADILSRLGTLGIDGVQMVCYKAYDEVSYLPGGITQEKAGQIGRDFAKAGKIIPLIGAYFNPVHSNREKAKRCEQIFAEYLRVGSAMGCNIVGSETGSYSDDPWVYHPRNRTDDAVQQVVATFSRLCDVAKEHDAVVAMEGAAGHVCFDPDTLFKAQKIMARENTRVIFDLYNYMDASNQMDYLQILDRGLELFGDRILLFHMKDCVFENGKDPKQVPFGIGQMDKRAILQKIKAHNPQATLVLEGTVGADIPLAVNTIREIWEDV